MIHLNSFQSVPLPVIRYSVSQSNHPVSKFIRDSHYISHNLMLVSRSISQCFYYRGTPYISQSLWYQSLNHTLCQSVTLSSVSHTLCLSVSHSVSLTSVILVSVSHSAISQSVILYVSQSLWLQSHLVSVSYTLRH